MSGGDRLRAAMSRRSTPWWPRMLVVHLAIALSVLAAAAHIAPPTAPISSNGGAPGITAGLIPTAAVHVKATPREGFRLDGGRHVLFPLSPNPAGSSLRRPVQPPKLQTETVHGAPHRSPLHSDIALRAPPIPDPLG
jgi:hypothetical protein